MTQCEQCEGSGNFCATCGDNEVECACGDGQELVDCPHCDGTGEVEFVDDYVPASHGTLDDPTLDGAESDEEDE